MQDFHIRCKVLKTGATSVSERTNKIEVIISATTFCFKAKEGMLTAFLLFFFCCRPARLLFPLLTLLYCISLFAAWYFSCLLVVWFPLYGQAFRCCLLHAAVNYKLHEEIKKNLRKTQDKRKTQRKLVAHKNYSVFIRAKFIFCLFCRCRACFWKVFTQL